VFASAPGSKIMKTFEPKYNCLLGYYLTCRVCGENNIPFWHLRARTLHSKTNLFGIPVYDKAIGEREFCNYNLFQISICPSCLFASNQIDCFQRQDKPVGVSEFDPRKFSAKWQPVLQKRKKLVGKDDSWLYSNDRGVPQAIVSYQLAVETHELLGQFCDDAELANHQRKVVSFMLTQAELLMSKGERADAEKLLQIVKEKLEMIFPNLEKEAGIRAAQLFIMISLYFKDYDNIGEYLNYLNNYSKLHTVAHGSAESKALATALNQTSDAWQERDKVAFDALKSFHLQG